ncbi:MAG: hypothetical protein C5B50_14315 [Verrucomicrobia bacterium]|nr:MAG: hypothetical protein C5B50_14315 [Verrucomicrobiota bacterium]
MNTNFPFVGPFLSTLTLLDVQPQESGHYSVVVTNAYGSATSCFATLTVYSNLLTGIKRSSNGIVTVSIAGLPNSTNCVFAATNLSPPIFWQLLFTSNNIPPNGIWQFIDTNAPAYPTRFYRFSTP